MTRHGVAVLIALCALTSYPGWVQWLALVTVSLNIVAFLSYTGEYAAQTERTSPCPTNSSTL